MTRCEGIYSWKGKKTILSPLRVPEQACFGKHVLLTKKSHIFGTHMAPAVAWGTPCGRSVLAMGGGNTRRDAIEVS